MTDFEKSSLDIDTSLRLKRPAIGIGDIPTAFASMALGAIGLSAEVAYKVYKKTPEVVGSLRSSLAEFAGAIGARSQRPMDEIYGVDTQATPPPYVLPYNSESAPVGRPTVSAVQEIPKV